MIKLKHKKQGLEICTIKHQNGIHTHKDNLNIDLFLSKVTTISDWMVADCINEF